MKNLSKGAVVEEQIEMNSLKGVGVRVWSGKRYFLSSSVQYLAAVAVEVYQEARLQAAKRALLGPTQKAFQK